MMGRLLIALGITTMSAHAALSVAVVDSMTRVSRTDALPRRDLTALQAMRGEWESLQIVLNGTSEELKSAVVESAELTGADGKTLPAPVVLREHYVKVSKSTPMSPLPPGDYPDALVPTDFKWQDLPEGEHVNQPYWVDVFVPYATPPGTYKGELRVVGEGRAFLATRPFTVTVLDADLPVVPRLRTSFMTIWRRIAEVHGFDRQKEPPSAELTALLDQYYDLLAEHRLSIDQTYPTYPDGKTGKLNAEAVEKGMRKQMLHRHASTLGLPIWPEWPFPDPLGKDRKAAMKYTADWMKLLGKIRCESRGYVIMGDLDEPNDADAYAKVRRWGDFFNEVEAVHQVKVPLLITEQPSPDSWWWGRLDGDVDIWVPHFSQVWQDLESPNGKRDIERRLKAGDEVWCYAALVQMPGDWEKAYDHPKQLKQSNPPVWCLDFPPMNHRILAWLMPRHGITGLTYWDTLFASPGVNVWQDAGTFQHPSGDVYNGDGSFIYPATAEHQGKDMPIASMRLKWLRDMAEDYDYFMMARDLGLEKEALEIGASFARGFGDWEDDVTKLTEARKKLADLIVKKGGGA